MRHRWFQVFWALCIAAAGCTNDADGDDPQDDGGATDGAAGSGGAGDAAPDAADAEGDAAAPPPDAAPRDDSALPDVGEIGADAAVDPVVDCASACARYAECDQAAVVFGGEAECRAACERSDAGADLSDWFRCVEAESCNLLRRCRLPAPPALTCDEACAAVDGCLPDLPYDCAAVCGEPDDQEDYVACAERLGAACDTVAFSACLGETVFRGCGQRCSRAGECGVDVAADCFGACLEEGFDADPLRRRRQEQRNACVSLAGVDCERVDECLHPEVVEPLPVDEATFCRLWNQCGFGGQIPCEIMWQDLANPRAPGGGECAIALLDQGCPPEPFLVFEQCLRGGVPVPRGPGCNELCEALDLCDRPEAGDDRLACVSACSERLAVGGAAAEREALRFPCGVVETCAELDQCLIATDPARACAAHCAALDGCGLADADCAARCDAELTRDRHVAWRSCVAGAADCESVGACAPRPALPCDVQCARMLECGLLDPAGLDDCVVGCDDRHFADPVTAARRFACLVTAPVCSGAAHSVDACLGDAAIGGSECLAWCRVVGEECRPGGPALEDCLLECAQGYTGDALVRFEAAGECLGVRDPAGDCDILGGCVPEVPEIDCDSWCGGLAACGRAGDDCVAACGADPLAGLHAVQQAACVRDAGDDCEAVTACVEVTTDVPPPVDPDAFCAAYARCQFERDFPCEEAVRLLEQSPGDALQCAFDIITQGCPREPFGVLEQCTGNPGVENFPGCDALCEARAACGTLDETTVRCRADCNATLRADPEGAARLAPALRCAESNACDALASCLSDASPERQCARHCEAVEACGAGAEGCAVTCDRDFARRRHAAWRNCVAGAADCDEVTACAPAPVVPCDAWCGRLTACGLDGGAPGVTCEARCDDLHFEDPQGMAVRVVCGLTAPECVVDAGGHDVETCASAADPADLPGHECLGWCRAVTECDPRGERTFVGCVTDCARGFEGVEALEFHAARDCLADVRPDAECRPILACLGDAPVVDCDAHCAAVAACGLDDGGCAAACVAAPDVGEAGCVLEAGRLGRRCAGIAACIGFEPPPVSDACAALCDRQAACDRAVDPFLCRMGCVDAPEIAVRAACAEVTECAQLGACLEIDAARPRDCAAPCAVAAACDAFPDAESCEAMCAGRAASPDAPDDYLAGLAECVGPACEPAAAAECFSFTVGDCAEACALLEACGAGAGDECEQGCLEAQRADPELNERQRACIIDFLSDGRCNIDGAIACFDNGEEPPDRPDEPPPPPPPGER